MGAYISHDMMRASYSMRSPAPPGAYSWSSRGPCADGAAGLALCAPGGAVASVARFTLRDVHLMNGTSMAAPHVAGAVGESLQLFISWVILFDIYRIYAKYGYMLLNSQIGNHLNSEFEFRYKTY